MGKAAGADSRAAAAAAVARVVADGRSLEPALADGIGELSPADAALARMLAYGVLRHYRSLSARAAPRLKRAPSARLAALLAVGVFQLEYTRVPAHAAIHATVAATTALGLARARGAVNAVLRGHQRAPVALADRAAEPGVFYSFPDWLVAAIRSDWRERWPAVLAASNERAPLWLRVNRRRAEVAAFRSRLQASGRAAKTCARFADALRLATAESAQMLPGVAAGEVSIQDAGAQLAADCVAPRAGQRVLDACCAPGNKTAHLAERADVELVALDRDDARLATARANLARLGLAAQFRAADAADPARAWWDGRAFDRILIDAPCSGTGVIRRHPDIKWLRRAADVERAAATQRALLAALWPALAAGGRLVYAVCSVLAAEGSAVVSDFVAGQADARLGVPPGDWGEDVPGGRRLAPGEHGCDGFFYAVVERTGAPGA